MFARWQSSRRDDWHLAASMTRDHQVDTVSNDVRDR